MIHVFLDPAGCHTLGDYVLVLAPTGVTYENQCGGYACDRRCAEGYLVSVGSQTAVAALDAWIAKEFRGHCHEPARDWTPPRLERLAALLGGISCYRRESDGDDRSHPLALDRARLQECVEAWIPVITPLGPGVLLRENSD